MTIHNPQSRKQNVTDEEQMTEHYVITGPQQRRVPKDMNDALKSTSFKKELPQFLANEWQDQSYASALGDCEVYLDVPGNCYKFYIEHGIMKRNTVDELRNNHEEDDMRHVSMLVQLIVKMERLL